MQPIEIDPDNRPFLVNPGHNCLNICAHCGECLRQIVADPNKINVVLHYKDETGAVVPWGPDQDGK